MRPYTCIRCGYQTRKRPDMIKHFSMRKKICPGSVNDIELTDELKEKILLNRVIDAKKIAKDMINDEKIKLLNKQREIKEEKEQLKLDKLKLKEAQKKFEDQVKTLNNESYHYVYLIKPKESVYNNVDIYKPGMTITKEKSFDLKRLKSYGIESELIMVSQCNNANLIEKEILKEFNANFERPYGNEYFIGNKNIMKKIIHKILYEEEEL